MVAEIANVPSIINGKALLENKSEVCKSKFQVRPSGITHRTFKKSISKTGRSIREYGNKFWVRTNQSLHTYKDRVNKKKW